MTNVQISKRLAKRLQNLSQKTHRSADVIVRTALTEKLDYEEWLLKEIGRGIIELDRGEVVSHHDVVRMIHAARAEHGKKKKKAA